MGSEDDPDGLSIQSLEDLTQENLGLIVVVKTLEAENDALAARIAQLEDDNGDLREKIDEGLDTIDSKIYEIGELEERIEELESALLNKE